MKTNTTGYPVIDNLLESIAPRGDTKMTTGTETIPTCAACGHAMEPDEDLDDAGLCAMCSDLNLWAHEEGYDAVYAALNSLRRLGEHNL